MVQFLESVAEAYSAKYNDLSRLTFVMPNKRSGAFLLKQMRKLSTRPRLAPRVISISDFVAEVAGTMVDSRIDLLFCLYDCYTKIPGAVADLEFDKFVSWGETILSDFNEIDIHLADADEIFKNVSDLNEIQSDFLSDEQKRVLEEYFGYQPTPDDNKRERFWRQFNDPAASTGVRKKFLMLWQLLMPLYRSFRERLLASNLAYEGMAYRLAAEKIGEGSSPLEGEKLIFVGFNALTVAERHIFKALRNLKVDVGMGEEAKADFVWDVFSTFGHDDDDPAVKFVKINSGDGMFPTPEWVRNFVARSRKAEKTKVEVIAVPSNVMQVKVVGSQLHERFPLNVEGQKPEEAEKIRRKIRDARIAVVLPDESLLLPLLYSLPEGFQDPNITMGFPLRHTPVISFMGLVRRLQSHWQRRGTDDVFLLEDVKSVLAHPYSHTLFEHGEINKLLDEFYTSRRITVTAAELRPLGVYAELLFKGIPENTHPSAVVEYIRSLLQTVALKMETDKADYLRAKVERAYIASYLDAIARLDLCLSTYNTAISVQGLLRQADRLIAAESVAFEGEPLEGLQIMGVLETRCLDFDTVMMPSVNEKLMPRVGRTSTFIPNILRSEFCLPPANYQEELFSYYFFRLIKRSKNAVLTYDNRASEKRAGGVSRYILQMRYLSDDVELSMKEAKFARTPGEETSIRIEKSGEVWSNLQRFIIPNGGENKDKPKNFSPSALTKYCSCPLKFLYNSVMELYLERDKMETIDSIDLGTIVHNAMQRLYLRGASDGVLLSTPVVWTPERLEALLREQTPAGELLIESEAKRAILNVHFRIPEKNLAGRNLSGSAAIVLDNIVEFIRNIIRGDINQGGFELYGCEIKEVLPYTLPDGTTVNVKMVIDRLDKIVDKGVEFLRVVDYKTGNPHFSGADLDEVFEGSYHTEYMLQLFIYAEMFLKLVRGLEPDKVPPGIRSIPDLERQLKVVIYNVPVLPALGGLKSGVMVPQLAGSRINTMADLRQYEEATGETFLGRFDSLLTEILNKEVPFEAEPNEDRCGYCDYKLYCAVASAKGES